MEQTQEQSLPNFLLQLPIDEKLAQFEELKEMTLKFDPYQQTWDEKTCEILAKYHLDPTQMDPFSLTNKLLVLLDEFEQLLRKN